MLETTKEQLRKEGIELDSSGILFLTRIKAVAGSIIVTTNRLAFFTSGNPLAGWLFKLIYKKLGPHVCLSIPFNEIVEVKPTKVGINKKMFEVVLSNGKSYKLGCNKKEIVEQWIVLLNSKITL
jgi:hypothetical protein